MTGLVAVVEVASAAAVHLRSLKRRKWFLAVYAGATAVQAARSSGATILGWSLDRIKTAIANNIPSATTTRRGGGLVATQTIVDAGTSTGNFLWNISNLLRLIRSQLSSWARQGDVSTVPAAKLGAGTRDGTKFLRDDGTWQAPPTSGGGGSTALTQRQQVGLLKYSSTPPNLQFAHPDELTQTLQMIIDNPDLLTGDIWYQRKLNETAIGTRIKWTNTTFFYRLPDTK